MEIIISTLIYILGNSVAFNVILPIWYLVMQFTNVI